MVSGLADEELIGKLKRRHRMAESLTEAEIHSEGEEVSSAADVAAGTAALDTPGTRTQPTRTTSSFSMADSPPRSRSASPRPAIDAAAELPALAASPGRCSRRRSRLHHEESPASSEEAEKLCYEWQFEILNSLPREKGLELVDHLRRTEREKAQAKALALRLHRANVELEQKLREAAAPEGQSPSSRSCRCYLLWGCALFVVSVFVLGLGLVAGALLPKEAFGDLAAATPKFPSEACQSNLESVLLQGGADPAGEKLTDGSRMQESTLGETSAKECNATVEALQDENQQMRGQLQSLWKDIKQAVDRGQDMVCWKV